MRSSPLTEAALNLVRSAIDRVWPEQFADAWDSKPPSLIGLVERPTHMLITSWAIDQLKSQFPELDIYRGAIIDGANATELHELPLKPADLEVGWKYGLNLEEKRKQHKGTNAGTDDIVGWWNDAAEAVRAGNKPRGYFILGIMLHMIEDMGVPSHARGIYHQAPSLGEPLQFDNFEMMGFSNWVPAFDNINKSDPRYSEPWRYYHLSQDWTNQDTPANYTRDGFSKTWTFASEPERQLLRNRQGRTCQVVVWTLRSASLAIQQIESAGTLVSQPAGGTGGDPFTDFEALAGGRTRIIQASSVATALTIKTGSRVDNVQLTLNTGRLPGHGGSGGDSHTLNLGAGEYIESANVWVNSFEGGHRLFAIQFITSKGNILEGGSKTGTRSNLEVPQGRQVVGFLGRSGSGVDQLGVITSRVVAGTLVSQPAGGTGGDWFSDFKALAGGRTRIIQANSVATALTIRTYDRVDNVQLTLSTGQLPGHGGSGGDSKTLNLGPGEYIKSANVWVDKFGDGYRLFAIQFITSEGNVLEGGKQTGTRSNLQVPQGYQVVGFVGRSGSAVDQLGVIVSQATPRDVIRDETES